MRCPPSADACSGGPRSYLLTVLSYARASGAGRHAQRPEGESGFVEKRTEMAPHTTALLLQTANKVMAIFLGGKVYTLAMGALVDRPVCSTLATSARSYHHPTKVKVHTSAVKFSYMWQSILAVGRGQALSARQ